VQNCANIGGTGQSATPSADEVLTPPVLFIVLNVSTVGLDEW